MEDSRCLTKTFCPACMYDQPSLITEETFLHAAGAWRTYCMMCRLTAYGATRKDVNAAWGEAFHALWTTDGMKRLDEEIIDVESIDMFDIPCRGRVFVVRNPREVTHYSHLINRYHRIDGTLYWVKGIEWEARWMTGGAGEPLALLVELQPIVCRCGHRKDEHQWVTHTIFHMCQVSLTEMTWCPCEHFEESAHE